MSSSLSRHHRYVRFRSFSFSFLANQRLLHAFGLFLQALYPLYGFFLAISLNRFFFLFQVLSEDQKIELQEAFDLFDADKTGFIDLHELKVLMRALGFESSRGEVTKLVYRRDPSNEGSVDLPLFLDISLATLSLRMRIDHCACMCSG